MKFINVLLLLLGLFGVSEPLKNNAVSKIVRASDKVCRKITGTPIQMINQFHEDGEIFDDRRFKCFIGCLFEVAGMIKGKKIAGSKVLADLKQVSSEDSKYWDEKIPKCAQAAGGNDICEVVFDFLKCIKKYPTL